MSVIDTATEKVTTTVTVGAQPVAPQPAQRRAWTLPIVGIAIAVIGLGIAGWYFRASLPFIGRFVSPAEPIGWATIAQADTPAFAEPTRACQSQ